jgi:hypothetical protein
MSDDVQKELLYIPRDNYPIVAPRVVSPSMVEYERIVIVAVVFTVLQYTQMNPDQGTEFGVFHFDAFELGHVVYTVYKSELTAILQALTHIKIHSPERFLIISNSMSSFVAFQSRLISLKTHPLIYEYKEALWFLLRTAFELIFFIPAHVRVTGIARFPSKISKTVARACEKRILFLTLLIF